MICKIGLAFNWPPDVLYGLTRSELAMYGSYAANHLERLYQGSMGGGAGEYRQPQANVVGVDAEVFNAAIKQRLKENGGKPIKSNEIASILNGS